MASKFQNRLVGTVIIVALGVIVLPGVLDGQKKHYKEEFAAIPLVPKADEQPETELVPPVTQSLPAQPPGNGGAVAAGNDNPSQAESGSTMPTSHNQPTVVTPPPVQQKVQPPDVVERPKPQPRPEPIVKPVEKPVEKSAPVEKPKPVTKPEAKSEAAVDNSRPPAETAPVGLAYVVQLGALKNAAKVNEIVAQLRLSGYLAFTVPATPVQGQITRIYVGPDASKAKMQAAIGALQGISGLGGVVKPYAVH
ncbi:cell division protein DedD [Erwinia pyrifoliae]|uniref:cell division protein DedD n=1 Tax=Erwinia pyrifoliae TaxID=79967 RepID=UPI0021C08BAE|nr:cell division protein DedD [Erwinia pyrifoliae]UXK11179.1 cell division protein DedD [Erwinia pyrifoliae]